MRFKEQRKLIKSALKNPEQFTTDELIYFRMQLRYVERSLRIKKWNRFKEQTGFGNAR
jgi:hypothetical protein|tara:strand:+ start:732 stop:905 length:174 start_codon:yes stop_codon:yes gene_type:complete